MNTSLNYVYRIVFNEMFSFVIKIAINVIRAELLAIGTPKLELTIDSVEDTIVDDDPIKHSKHI